MWHAIYWHQNHKRLSDLRPQNLDGGRGGGLPGSHSGGMVLYDDLSEEIDDRPRCTLQIWSFPKDAPLGGLESEKERPLLTSGKLPWVVGSLLLLVLVWLWMLDYQRLKLEASSRSPR